MSIIIGKILLQKLAWTILKCQTSRRYFRVGKSQRLFIDLMTFLFPYCPHNHLLYELWLEQMLQLVIFLEPKFIYIFLSFDFHHFLELLVDGTKREYIINNSNKPKTKFLGPFTDTAHANNCGSAFRQHRVGTAFSSLTSFFTKQYCFSSMFFI